MSAIIKAAAVAVLAASTATASSWVEPIYNDELAAPAGRIEVPATPLILDDAPPAEKTFVFAEIEAEADAGASEASSEESSAPQAPPAGPLPGSSAYTSPTIPGPWLGSYAGRNSELGYTVPPYAFDPRRYSTLGPYRALTNMYSDGTPYPLNMQKYDHFYPNGASPYYAGGGGVGAQQAQQSEK